MTELNVCIWENIGHHITIFATGQDAFGVDIDEFFVGENTIVALMFFHQISLPFSQWPTSATGEELSKLGLELDHLIMFRTSSAASS